MSERSEKIYPFKIGRPNKADNDALNNYMGGMQLKCITIGPKKYLLHEYYLNEAANIYNLKLRPDDTFVATFPKSGTTWTQELVWLLQNNLDFEKAKSIRLHERFSYLEITTGTPAARLDKENSISLRRKAFASHDFSEIAELPSPRFIKSHLPLSLLPPTLLDTAKVDRCPR